MLKGAAPLDAVVVGYSSLTQRNRLDFFSLRNAENFMDSGSESVKHNIHIISPHWKHFRLQTLSCRDALFNIPTFIVCFHLSTLCVSH